MKAQTPNSDNGTETWQKLATNRAVKADNPPPARLIPVTQELLNDYPQMSLADQVRRAQKAAQQPPRPNRAQRRALAKNKGVKR